MKTLNKICYECKWFFLEKINWCHPTDRNNHDKPTSWFYTIYCWAFYPIPWMEPQPCWCCASVRGLIYGIIIGLGLGYLIYGL